MPPYDLGAEQGELLARMPRLKVVQTLTAGVDHIRGQVPEGVLLCNGRGIHNASTAELALTLTLASLRGIPGFVEDQKDQPVEPGLAPVAGRLDRADRRVRRHRARHRAPAASPSRSTCCGWPAPPATACTPSPSCPTCCRGPTW